MMPAALALSTLSASMVHGAALPVTTSVAVPGGAWVAVDTESDPPSRHILAMV